ncbi:MAG TPA: Uma2 family endonuclease, partial [Chloroflexia bacterium]|nr:Uma2 family endonuclease [Chloroflexia bacterium]
KLLNRQVPEEWTVRVQSPIYLNVNTEPEPDLVLLKPRDYLKLQHHPGPDDVLLTVEVADSTVRSDRRYKVPLYARAGIPEVWVVNIPKKVVEVYSDPFEGKYQSIRRVGRGEVLNLTALPGVAVAIDDILR